MLRAFLLALGQLGDARILRVLAKSVGLTLLVFAALGLGLWKALDAWLIGGDVLGGMGAGLAAVVIMVPAMWLLFRVIALAVLQFFGDEVVRAVEALHYPAAAARARSLSLHEEARAALASLGRTVGYNLAALPVALLLLVTGVGAPLVFASVNAVLLGRELTEMVALRHAGAVMPGFATRTALGALIVAGLSVPFVNLLAPVIGAAMATHLVHAKGSV